MSVVSSGVADIGACSSSTIGSRMKRYRREVEMVFAHASGRLSALARFGRPGLGTFSVRGSPCARSSSARSGAPRALVEVVCGHHGHLFESVLSYLRFPSAPVPRNDAPLEVGRCWRAPRAVPTAAWRALI